MSAAADARYAELTSSVARTWKARSLDKSWKFAGVYHPVSGDKLACLAAGPSEQLRLYGDRDRPMDDRLLALESSEGQLWIEGEL